MKWFKKVLVENYANFSGRARRQEYWMFVLIQIAIFFSLVLISNLLEEFVFFDSDTTLWIFSLYSLATLVPWLAVNVRRLHDTGKSGGYLFINLIPLIGRIWYIVLVASNGDVGPNKYGPDPKNSFDNEIDDIGKPLIEE